MADHLCGAFREGHFEGVLTVVAKLFNIVQPDYAVFGQKDFQQAALIRRMVLDLDYAIEIDVAPTGREADGIAQSSRNVFLSPEERSQATSLVRALRDAQAAFARGEHDPEKLRALARAALQAQPLVREQYVEIVDPNLVQPVATVSPGDVLAIAAYLGATRLIDNWALGSDDGFAGNVRT
jgi:pantoate--beta-alanine ligase